MFTKIALRLSFLVGLCFLPIQAQNGITVAAFGYRNPGSMIVAAPGQVLTVSVYGVAGRFASPVFPIVGATGLPLEVEDISANFVQGTVSVQLPIRGVQQSPCPASGTCTPATTVTLQIPYELEPESASKPELQILEKGTMVAEVDISPEADRVHILNTCDQTGTYLSIAVGLPAGTCAPILTHASGPLVSSSNPAVGGETVVLWAYGLGAVNHPFQPICCSSPDQIPTAVQPFTVALSYFDPGRFPLRRLAEVVPSYAGSPGGGLYQIVFTLPPAPSSLSPCSGTTGNLRVLLTGPSSADGAEVCLQAGSGS